LWTGGDPPHHRPQRRGGQRHHGRRPHLTLLDLEAASYRIRFLDPTGTHPALYYNNATLTTG